MEDRRGVRIGFYGLLLGYFYLFALAGVNFSSAAGSMEGA